MFENKYFPLILLINVLNISCKYIFSLVYLYVQLSGLRSIDLSVLTEVLHQYVYLKSIRFCWKVMLRSHNHDNKNVSSFNTIFFSIVTSVSECIASLPNATCREQHRWWTNNVLERGTVVVLLGSDRVPIGNLSGQSWAFHIKAKPIV